MSNIISINQQEFYRLKLNILVHNLFPFWLLLLLIVIYC